MPVSRGDMVKDEGREDASKHQSPWWCCGAHMSTTPPPSTDVPVIVQAESGSRFSQSLQEGDISSNRSSLSISGPSWTLPDDFDASRYESEDAIAKVIKVQAFLRKVSVLQHYNLICTSFASCTCALVHSCVVCVFSSCLIGVKSVLLTVLVA